MPFKVGNINLDIFALPDTVQSANALLQQILHLGSKLPPPPGGPLYPAVLDPVEGSDAQALLEQYHALDPESAGEVGATDWAELAQRMRYIIALFRSRQCDDRLLQQPFDEAQRSALLAGEVPAGPL